MRTASAAAPKRTAKAAANKCDRLLGFFWSRGLAGANRPDRFVGHRQRSQFAGVYFGQVSVDLGADLGFCLTSLTLIERLAATEDRRQTSIEGGAHFADQVGIVFGRSTGAAPSAPGSHTARRAR